MKYLVASSMGNDSIALIQLMINNGEDFGVVYNDTGWASEDWNKRVTKASQWLMGLGVTLYITKSEGMEALVRRKKGWPMPASKMQFCTSELKEGPTIKLLDKIDPDGDLIIVTGRRRDESQNRSTLPLWQYESNKHGGRDVYNPLINYDSLMRDGLLASTPFEPLPHSSQECYPCVCANKQDLSALADSRVFEIEAIELSMGFTKNKKPRTMFRPYRVGGGVGIAQAVDWGRGCRGYKSDSIPLQYQYAQQQLSESESDIAYDDDTKEGREFSRQCDGGYCGS